MKPDRAPFVSTSMSGAELVLGVVAPVGTDVALVGRTIEDRLQQFGYEMETVRLSELLEEFSDPSSPLVKSPYLDRVVSLMDAGNKLRRETNRGDALALAAIGKVQRSRQGGDPNHKGPRAFTAYFLHSLKHPDEVQTLREVYGPGFFLLGVSASESDRLSGLMQRKNVSRSDAEALLKRDQSESEGHGQQTGKAFHLADAFIALDANQESSERQIWRVLDLLFGQPFITPSRDEYAMFLAYAASLKSADLSRQVGAVIVSSTGEVIATGANDVPAFGGGSYWPDPYVDWPAEEPTADKRDWAQGYDSNRKRRDEIVNDVSARLLCAEQKRVFDILANAKKEGADQELIDRLEKSLNNSGAQVDVAEALKGSIVMDLTEYGRAVHAEMAALMACTRVGVQAKGGTLYCTTFPCHGCTKHIVSSGIVRVLYIEPYPKSLAEELHGDAVTLKVQHEGNNCGTENNKASHVQFEAFNGIGPRKYLDLFSLSLSTGRPLDRKSAMPKKWCRKDAQLRVSMVPTSYLERENNAFDLLNREIPGGEE